MKISKEKRRLLLTAIREIQKDILGPEQIQDYLNQGLTMLLVQMIRDQSSDYRKAEDIWHTQRRMNTLFRMMSKI